MKKTQKQALAIGAGVAALAAATAGVYMLTGKNAKNRKKIKSWAGKMQKDVVTELRKAEKSTQSAYNRIVDTVAKNYKGMKNVNPAELAAATMELKSHWNAIREEMDNASQVVRRITPKSVKSKSRPVKVNSRQAPKKTAKKR
jgi:hypothetical protein